MKMFAGILWRGYRKGQADSESRARKTASGNLSLEAGVKEAARIIYVAHEDSKDKDFELEMSWISSADGPTKGRHQAVPQDILEEAEKAAKKVMEGEDDEETTAPEGDTMEE